MADEVTKVTATAVYIQKGDVIDVTNTTDATWGYHEVVPMATGIGVAQEVTEPNAVGGLAIVGVHALPTDETDVPVGTMVYFVPSTGKVAKATAEGAVIAGTAVGTPANGAIPVKINTVFAGGAAGTAGAAGEKGDPGVGVKAIAITQDNTSKAITAATWTGTDDKQNTITVTTAGK